ASTNDMGEYRLFWLPPGQYYIRAVRTDLGRGIVSPLNVPAALLNGNTVVRLTTPAPGTVPGVTVTSRTLANGTSVEEGTVPVYFPNVTQPDAATVVDVRPAANVAGINLTINPVGIYRIRGTIRSGAPANSTAAGPVDLVAELQAILDG